MVGSSITFGSAPEGRPDCGIGPHMYHSQLLYRRKISYTEQQHVKALLKYRKISVCYHNADLGRQGPPEFLKIIEGHHLKGIWEIFKWIKCTLLTILLMGMVGQIQGP